MSSINTNLSAMTALQSLKATQNAMSKNQNQISTGLRVGEASHNASYWSISTKMKSDNGALGAVKDSIKQSKAMINTYTSAMDKTLTYLNKMKEGLVAAAQPGADLSAIQTEFKAHIEGMKSAAGSATFNGQNWLSQLEPETVNLVTSYDGTSNKVNKLAIDTSKTNLFTNATEGKGGILNDVAAIKLDPSYVDVNVLGVAANDVIAVKLSGGETVRHNVTGATTVTALVNEINSNTALNTKVVASESDDGKLRLTSLDTSKTVTGDFLKRGAAGAASTDVAANAGTGTAGHATFGFTAGQLSRGDQIKFTVDGATAPTVFTVTDEDTIQKLVDSINEDKSLGVVASISGGNLRLSSAVSTGAVTVGTFDNFARNEGVAGNSSVENALKSVDEAIKKVTEGSAMLGANKALLETQEEFIGVLSDSLTAGVSAFIDADMNEASTRNQALQTQQQLGVQALSMANQNSQMILKLFQ